ncbi:hypothetical protein Goshw_025311 [Gossypium schwendimanii]|uniref:Uncharacterized protein n=1 Tax=Gossypium schwendimanii TaxID=34291 RepID=A0A7J9MPU9_GOSSC|nr:hypothetical protein [Gossypium schwendimanii]
MGGNSYHRMKFCTEFYYY